MVIKTYDPCCGCIKLKTGCLIISYVRLVVEVTLVYYGLKMKSSWFEWESESFILYFWVIYGFFLLLFLGPSIVACIILIVSLHLNHLEYVAWYVKHAWACIFITLAFGILFWPTKTQNFTLFGTCFILLLLQGYFLQMIYCYCEVMAEKPQPATSAVALALAPAPAPTPAPAPVPPPVPDRCGSDAK